LAAHPLRKPHTIAVALALATQTARSTVPDASFADATTREFVDRLDIFF
jgi:hypothetical protein